jgi:hypothetical protein
LFADRVDQRDFRALKPNACDLPDEARSVEPFVEQLLMRGGNVMAAFEVRSIEGDEVGIVGEWSGEGLPATVVPAVHHLLIKSADGSLASRIWCS